MLVLLLLPAHILFPSILHERAVATYTNAKAYLHSNTSLKPTTSIGVRLYFLKLAIIYSKIDLGLAMAQAPLAV